MWRRAYRGFDAASILGAGAIEVVTDSAPGSAFPLDAAAGFGELDPLLELIIEQHLDVEALCARGYDRRTVLDVTRMVRGSEYKRKQSAPGLKLTTKAFGTGRRIPIAQRWKG